MLGAFWSPRPEPFNLDVDGERKAERKGCLHMFAAKHPRGL